MKTAEITEINGVILTPEAQTQLKNLQSHNNDTLNEQQKHLTEIMVFLSTHIDEFSPEETPQIVSMISTIGWELRLLNNLRKP